MFSLCATRRASSTAPSAQHASARGGASSWLCLGHTLSVTPITSYPCLARSAAAIELSTPPLMATTTRPLDILDPFLQLPKYSKPRDRVGAGGWGLGVRGW